MSPLILPATITKFNQSVLTYSLIPSSSSSTSRSCSKSATTIISSRTQTNFAVITSSKKSLSKFNSRVGSSKSTETSSTETSSDEVISENKKQWQILQLEVWNIPWDWKIVLYVMAPYLMSILLTGIVESNGLEVLGGPHSQIVQTSTQSADETAVRLFIDQLLKTVIKLSVLYVFVSPYQPLPKDIFSYKWTQPFDLQSGWFIWGVGGLIAASTGVLLSKALISGSNVSQIQNEADSLVRLLPLIGASNISAVSLLGVLGILAPLCEETIYRGFLLTSLTRWLPVQVSVFVSSVVFTLAHQSPGKSTEIFIFGMVLGFVYTRTRNLVAPITMHACWNLGVIFVLIYIQSQGGDIHKFVS